MRGNSRFDYLEIGDAPLAAAPSEEGEGPSSASYRLVEIVGSHGVGLGEFNSPAAVAVDAAGCLYVADRYNHRVQKFGSSGAFLAKWGT